MESITSVDKRPIYRKYTIFYAACILGTMAILVLILESSGESWTQTFTAFIDGSFRDPGSWGSSLTVMVPLALVALGATIGFQAGFTNIGQEGQLIIGGAVASYVGIHLNAPGPLVLLALLIAGMLAGAVWVALAALLKFWRGVPEVLTTLLLITVAFQITGYGLKTTTLIADPNPPAGTRSSSSPELATNTRLGELEIFGNKLSISIFIAIAIAILVWLLNNKTLLGFRWKTLGKNQLIASRAGISKQKYGSGALLFSGAMAGLAGAVILASGITSYSFSPGFSLNFGWTGLLVALIARSRAWAAILVATFFAGLYNGSQVLAGVGVSRQIGDVVTALFVLTLLIPPAIIYFMQNKNTLVQI